MAILFVNSTKQDTWQDGVGCEEGTWDERGMKEGIGRRRAGYMR